MDRKTELNRFERVLLPIPMQEGDLRAAFKKGMLRKEDLEDGKYYLGYCRNAYVAQWLESENAFYYMRKKMGDVFPERILHPEDDNKKDLFVPFKKVDPTEEEKIKAAKYKSFVLYKKQG